MNTSKTTIRDDTAERHIRKYTNKNPLHQLALGKYFDVVSSEISALNPGRVLEFGCGEGLLAEKLIERDTRIGDYTGVDIREDAIRFAQSRVPALRFVCADIFKWPEAGETYDLVMACQVFEHLPDPRPFLERLLQLTRSHVFLTVPLEPWFRLLNLARGRDITRLGNHPEHVNHWGLKSFSEFVAASAAIEHAYISFPFVILKCARPK